MSVCNVAMLDSAPLQFGPVVDPHKIQDQPVICCLVQSQAVWLEACCTIIYDVIATLVCAAADRCIITFGNAPDLHLANFVFHKISSS